MNLTNNNLGNTHNKVINYLYKIKKKIHNLTNSNNKIGNTINKMINHLSKIRNKLNN